MSDTHPDYPLMDHAAGRLRAASGLPLNEVSPEAAGSGRLTIGDVQISAETLREQAAVARRAGYGPLAENLSRAAELTAVPNEELLQMYHLMRPGRATGAELAALADRLEREHGAPRCAALVREALAVYERRGLLRRPE